jgi:hypothetical protein
MAGDGQNDIIKKTGADDALAKTVLHINLVDLSGDGKTKTASTSQTAKSTELPIELAQAAQPTLQMNGRHSGPTGENPYTSAGGGVAPAFQVGGVRPQDAIPATTTTNAPKWDDPAAQAQRNANLQGIAAQNQQQIKANENQGNPNAAAGNNGKITDLGDDLDGNPVHHMEKLGGLFAAAMSVPYTQWGHPLVQRLGIPAQLKVDARAEAGELTPLGKAVDYLPKAYLKAFSPTYVAQTELKRILPIEAAAKNHLAEIKTGATENLEALNMTKAAKAELKKVAEGSPTTEAGIAEKARAVRQMDYLEAAGKSGLKKPALAAIESNKLDFLKTNDKFLAGGRVAEKEAASLNWSGMLEQMGKANAFTEKEMAPITEIASKEKEFASIGGKLMSRGDLEAIQTATAEGKGFFGTIGSGLKRFGVPLAVVGTASLGQIGIARSLGDNDGTTVWDNIKNRTARIIEPTVPGAVAKDLALMLSPNLKTKAITYLGAQAYESESNMTRTERFGTMVAGLAPAALALAVKGDKELAVGLAVADGVIGLAAEVTSDFWFKDDKSLTTGGKAIKDLSANPKDLSHSTLKSSVSDFTAIGKEDPFLLTGIYDQAHKPQLTATSSALERQAVYKQQLVIGQAQGETILSNGLTKSQYTKMGDRNAVLTDPPNHEEDWRIAPTRGIDIGSMGAKALIGAVGSANLAEWAAVQTGTDTSGVEKQKQGIKDQLKDLFTAPHEGQIENALKGSEWGWGHTNDYNLVQFWKHDAFDYAHITDLVGRTADYNASQLPGMKTNLDAAQAKLDQVKGSNGSSIDVAAAQHMVDARTDALGLSTQYVAKLYRDKALMKLGEAQYMLENAHSGHTQSGGDISAELNDAATALNNSSKYVQGNADAKILANMTLTMYKSASLIPPTNFQPNP